MKYIKIFLFINFIVNMQSLLFAASNSIKWYQETGNWKVKDSNGNNIVNTRLCDNSSGQDKWYIIDANGNMVVSDLVQDKDNNYFSLETSYGENYGALRNTSGYYNGIYLDIDSISGIIKNQDGIISLKNNGCKIYHIDHNNYYYYGNSYIVPNDIITYSIDEIFADKIALEEFERIKDNGELLNYKAAYEFVKKILEEMKLTNVSIEELGVENIKIGFLVKYTKGKLLFRDGNNCFDAFNIDSNNNVTSYGHILQTEKFIRKAIDALK